MGHRLNSQLYLDIICALLRVHLFDLERHARNINFYSTDISLRSLTRIQLHPRPNVSCLVRRKISIAANRPRCKTVSLIGVFRWRRRHSLVIHSYGIFPRLRRRRDSGVRMQIWCIAGVARADHAHRFRTKINDRALMTTAAAVVAVGGRAK